MATIHRHKTAINRPDLSRPFKLALEDGLLTPNKSIFDYGCGLGGDIRCLKKLGFPVAGWDPNHNSDGKRTPAPVVNLGYVVNVIEDPEERRDELHRAWALAERLLIVSGRLAIEAPEMNTGNVFSDGCVTKIGTFQKFYEQQELRTWIEQTLSTMALPAAPGIFYIFRNEEDRISFVASRYRRRFLAPRISRSKELFKEHRDLLQSLIGFVTERGRLPTDDELPDTTDLRDVFGSTKRAFQVIKRVTDAQEWERIAYERAQDLLIYIALARFDGRPRYSDLDRSIRMDVKGFFSNYTKACQQADELLFSVGDIELVSQACLLSPLGKLTPQALYVHETTLEHLTPELRVYEGCARGYIGRVDGANLIKLRRDEPKISYLSYPDFEKDPNPALAWSLSVDLQTFRVRFRDYRKHRNRPILHRKETFLHPDNPLHGKFARLTRIEEEKGLYEETSRIGYRDGWQEVLKSKQLQLRGHRLVRSKN